MSERYFAHPGISNSAMKQISRSPAHFIQWIKDLPESSKKSHFRIGQALHDRILQDGSRIKVFDKAKTFTSVAGEKFLAEFHPKHICLTPDELAAVEGMEKALRAQDKIMRLINAGQKEVEIYGEEMTSHGPLPAKAMLDVLGKNYILDLKTTFDELQWFPHRARKLYAIQPAWYKHMSRVHYDNIDRDFYFVAVETTPPHGVRMFKAGPDLLLQGQLKILSAIETYARCLKMGDWPGYDTEHVEVI